jgi:hypothetical protein
MKKIDAYKRKLKAEELRSWSQLPSKGKSVYSFADDKYSNCWLYEPTLLKPSHFLSALRMRSGTISDWVSLKKATAIPFDQNKQHINETSKEKILCAITQKEIKACLSTMKNLSAPGPDGMEKKNINTNDTREAIRLFFNPILVAQKQPRNWKQNKTILIQKPGKNQNKVENLWALTISPILC